jgi:hypothetical protein
MRREVASKLKGLEMSPLIRNFIWLRAISIDFGKPGVGRACYALGRRLYRKFILTTEGMKNRPSPINISAGGSGTVGGKQFVVHP